MTTDAEIIGCHYGFLFKDTAVRAGDTFSRCLFTKQKSFHSKENYVPEIYLFI